MRDVSDSSPVVTGSGLVTALGFGVSATWDALLQGRTGIRAVGDAGSGSGMELAALVEEPFLRADVPDELRSHVKFLNGSGELAVTATAEAWRAAGWDADDGVPPEARGLWLAQMDAWDWSCIALRPAFALATEEFQEPVEDATLNEAAVRSVKPFFLLDSLKNNAFSFVSALFHLEGANTGVSGFAGATTHLLDAAARAVARGDVDRAVVTAAGRIGQPVARRDLLLHGLARAGGTPACRPFDPSSTGMVGGEAAATLAIERLGDARARGKEPLGALLGVAGVTGVPLEGVSAPRAGTVHDAVRRALADAEVQAGELAFVVLPAFGLPAADDAQREALAGIDAVRGVPVVSWRGALGHAALASELADAVLALAALEQGTVPGTVGGAACRPTAVRGRAALVVAAGLQGEASALVVGR